MLSLKKSKFHFEVPSIEMDSRLHFWTFKEPRNRFQGIDSASLCSLAGRHDNPIPTRFLAPIVVLKFQHWLKVHGVILESFIKDWDAEIFCEFRPSSTRFHATSHTVVRIWEHNWYMADMKILCVVDICLYAKKWCMGYGDDKGMSSSKLADQMRPLSSCRWISD